MVTSMPARQRGISFSGFLFGAFLLVVVSLFAFRMVPAYMQDAKIRNLFVTLANDPDMQNASPANIRTAYIKRAGIEDITAVSADDIEIEKVNGRLTLSATYAARLPLVANVSLYIEFNPSSAN